MYEAMPSKLDQAWRSEWTPGVLNSVVSWQMRTVNVSRKIQAPGSAVWDVLADFPNIADWNSGIKTSYATGDKTEGIGATRHCDLAPAGTLEETVREWEPGEKLVISIDSATKLPIKRGLATFDLAAGDTPGQTKVSMNYEYETKWGFLGKLMGGTLDRPLTKGFTRFLADLDTAASSSG